MKTKFSILLFLFSFMMINAQSFEKLLFSKKDIPTVIINGNIIASSEIVKEIPSDKVKFVAMKEPTAKVTETYKSFSNLSEYGFMLWNIENVDINTKTQDEIRNFLAADAKTKIYVDGYLLSDGNLNIATKAIKELEIISPNERDLLAEKIINIWTLEKDSRIAGIQSGGVNIIK
ncbi:hypothetical protein SAMN05421638_2223 [Kaistella treverensis]|uniref:Uncharacterized protein n=1 Tax=Kaistella treverensis TaxID=631455 RepID=A0A1I3NU78_9FLAO|nr:hypothetical protein [Kaistella treverensis]SFJ12560.1 hypothetical protein SAMN05421638_2223 [Kaistella treverensis]